VSPQRGWRKTGMHHRPAEDRLGYFPLQISTGIKNVMHYILQHGTKYTTVRQTVMRYTMNSKTYYAMHYIM